MIREGNFSLLHVILNKDLSTKLCQAWLSKKRNTINPQLTASQHLCKVLSEWILSSKAFLALTSF